MPLSSFVDAHCLYFDTSSEHQLQHTDIHNSYVALCESLLSAHLDAVGLSQSAFVRVCELGLQSSDAAARQLTGEVLLLDEYALFHKRMVQRNIELDAQVLTDCLALQTKQTNKEKQRERQRGANERSRRQQAEGSEDEALRLAIELSLLEEQSTKKERERETAEIEYAIQLSLALQAEELRQAEERQRESQQPHQQHEQTQSRHEPPQAGKEEEHKEAAAPQTLSAAGPPTMSSSSHPTAASLAPLKHLRRAYENNVQRVEAAREERAAAVTSVQQSEQCSAGAAADESDSRQQFLRSQRDKLIARNKEAGTKQLSAFNADLAATEQAVKQQQKHDLSAPTATAASPATAAVDAKRAAMQAVLKARLRAEAEKTIASRTEQRSLEEQLQMLQSLEV